MINEVESTVHFFLHCPLLTNERSTPFSTLRNLDSKWSENTDSLLTTCLSKEIRTRQLLMQPRKLFYQLRDLMSEPLFIS